MAVSLSEWEPGLQPPVTMANSATAVAFFIRHEAPDSANLSFWKEFSLVELGAFRG